MFFDKAQACVVDITNKVMGSEATWVKDEDTTYQALVKFEDKPGSQDIGHTKYQTDSISIEIKDEDFPGLRQMIDEHDKVPISVKVRGTQKNFYAITAESISDGYCTRIMLKPAV